MISVSFADILVDSCSNLTQEGETYILTSNLVGAPNELPGFPDNDKACIKITASQITLDCNGKTITYNGDGATPTHGISLLSVSNVTIKNCAAILNYTYGIRIENSQYNQILNTTVYNTTYGIYLISSSDNIITNNTVHNNTYGFGAIGGFNNTFSKNFVYYNGDGFFLGGSTHTNTLSENLIYNTSRGIHVSFSSKNNITLNEIYDNYWGIYLDNANENNFSNNKIYRNNKCFELYKSSNNLLTHNQIYDNIFYGIKLNEESNQNIILSNTIYDALQTAIDITSSNDTEIKENNIYGSNFGILLKFSNNHTIQTNSLNNNTVGLEMIGITNTTVSQNIIYSNEVSIVLIASNNNSILDNEIYDNSDTAVISESSSNNFFSNNSVYNATEGFVLISTNNSFFSNNSIYNIADIAFSLYTSSNNTLDKNIIYKNYYGLVISGYSSNNTISNNTIYNNDGIGIQIDEPADNNTLIQNTIHSNEESGVLILGKTTTLFASNTIYKNKISGVTLEDGSVLFIQKDHYYNNSYDFIVKNNVGSLILTLQNVIFDAPDGKLSLRNYANISLNTTLKKKYSFFINWSENPSGTPPTGYALFGKSIRIGKYYPAYLLIIDSITFSWNPSEVSGYNPSSLEVWLNNETDWIEKASNQTINTTAKSITINNFANESILTILGRKQLIESSKSKSEYCSRKVKINYTIDCLNDILIIKLIDETNNKLIDNEYILISHGKYNIERLKSNDSGEILYKLPSTLDTILYNLEFEGRGYYCPAKEEFNYTSCHGCKSNQECNEKEYCYIENEKTKGVCKLIECSCGEIVDHKCIQYQCCTDSDCIESNFYCDAKEHICKEKKECIDNTQCSESMYCDLTTNKCKLIEKGKCGYIANHSWKDYECCEDSDCKGEYKIVGKEKEFIGNIYKFTLVGPYCENHICHLGPLAKRDVLLESSSGERKILQTSENGEGQFVVEKEEYKISYIINNGPIRSTLTIKSLAKEKEETSLPTTQEKLKQSNYLDAIIWIVIVGGILAISFILWNKFVKPPR